MGQIETSVLSMGQIELNCELYDQLSYLKKELSISIKMDFALNNLNRLICHKTQTNKQINEHPLPLNFVLPINN